MPYQNNVKKLATLNSNYDLISYRLQKLEQESTTDDTDDQNDDSALDVWKEDYLDKLAASKYYKTDLSHIIQELASIKVDGVLVSKLSYSNDGTVEIELIATKEAAYIDYFNTVDYNLNPFDISGEYHDDVSKITFNFYHALNSESDGDENATN